MKSWFFIKEICSGFAWPLHNISLFILSFEPASSLGGLMREETVTQMQTAKMNGGVGQAKAKVTLRWSNKKKIYTERASSRKLMSLGGD